MQRRTGWKMNMNDVQHVDGCHFRLKCKLVRGVKTYKSEAQIWKHVMWISKKKKRNNDDWCYWKYYAIFASKMSLSARTSTHAPNIIKSVYELWEISRHSVKGKKTPSLMSICTTDGFCDGKHCVVTTTVVRSFACCRIGMTDGWQSWRMRTRLKVSIQPS